jgi:hypothetical protein
VWEEIMGFKVSDEKDLNPGEELKLNDSIA